MNLSNTNLDWLKEKGGQLFYLTFRARTIPLFGILAMGAIPVSFIAGLSQEGRLLFAGIFSLFTMATVPYISNMITIPAITMIHFSLFRNKYKAREYDTEEIQQLKDSMSLPKVQVFTTDNPWITGPFCNMLSNKVYLPELWTHPELEPEASVSHEFGHLKTRRISSLEYLLGAFITFSVTIFLRLNTIPIIAQVSGIALELLVFTHISRRNELRADKIGMFYGGPEGLISLFEKLKHEARHDDGSETHPSYNKRLEQLYKELDKKN